MLSFVRFQNPLRTPNGGQQQTLEWLHSVTALLPRVTSFPEDWTVSGELQRNRSPTHWYKFSSTRSNIFSGRTKGMASICWNEAEICLCQGRAHTLSGLFPARETVIPREKCHTSQNKGMAGRQAVTGTDNTDL